MITKNKTKEKEKEFKLLLYYNNKNKEIRGLKSSFQKHQKFAIEIFLKA